MLVHCATNSRCERRAIARVASSDSGTVSTVISASSGEIDSIIASTATTVRIDVSNWLIVIDSDDLDVVDVVGDPAQQLTALASVEVGQRQPVHLSSTSERNAIMVRCTVTLSSRACAQIISAATRYRTSASASVRPPRRSPRLARHHIHPGQQVGEGVVAAGPGRGDGLCLGDSRRAAAARSRR